MLNRIMYIESKSAGLAGPARIGRVTFSKTGATLYYRGRQFQSLKGRGFKSNYRDIETGDEYRISGPGKDGQEPKIQKSEDLRPAARRVRVASILANVAT